MKNNDKPPFGSLILLPVIPALFALGLWLLGIPIDWSSWKTYAGLVVLTLMLGIALKCAGPAKAGMSEVHRAARESFSKKAAGRLLDGVEHNGFPEIACGT